jgi:hypothetical protein
VHEQVLVRVFEGGVIHTLAVYGVGVDYDGKDIPCTLTGQAILRPFLLWFGNWKGLLFLKLLAILMACLLISNSLLLFLLIGTRDPGELLWIYRFLFTFPPFIISLIILSSIHFIKI